MSDCSASRDAQMQSVLADLLGAPDEEVTLSGWSRVYGGNARHAYGFTAAWDGGRVLPCIMLSQVAAKHVESDTAAEYRVLRALNGSGVRSPEALALDADGTITGAPAIVLERLDGDASAVDFLRQPDRTLGRVLSEDLAEATADLHRFDWRAAGLDAGAADPVIAQIDHWEDSFRRHRLEPYPVLAWLFGWLRAHAPRPVCLSLIHGDLRPGNFLYRDDKITALLDWEMAHIGDPAEDIGWIYRALWSPERFLPLSDFLDLYAKHSGYAIPRRNVIFYRIFSEAKFAAISAAAAHSFASGGSDNLRHIDRAAKIPECLRLSLEWIAAEDWEANDAAA